MILVGLGSNLPFCGAHPQEILRLAISALGSIAKVAAMSRFYRSPAWPDPDDPAFTNAVVRLASAPPAEVLLDRLITLECAFGRRRGRKNSPRTLDLDLLACGDAIRREGGLLLPHPGIPDRGFVLAPLCDIAPGWRHPVSGRTAKEMLSALDAVAAEPLPG